MAGYYPPVGFHFLVSFELPGFTRGGNDARFQEVSGISAEINVEEIKEGGENRFHHRIPVRAKYPNLVLKRGLLTDSKLINWFRDAVENFNFSPTTITVNLLNEKHEPISTWTFVDAWPVKWSISNFNAGENQIAVDTIELSYKYYRRL